MDSLRQSRQSPGAPDPRPRRDEERSRGESACVRSDAEQTEADRPGESGVVQGTEAPEAVRSFFVSLIFHFIKMKDKDAAPCPTSWSILLLHSCSPSNLVSLGPPHLLLGTDLRLDSLFRPPLSHPHPSIPPTHRLQTLLLLPPPLQPSPPA